MLRDGAAILPCSGGAARTADGLTLKVISSLMGNDYTVHLLVHVPAATLWPTLGIIPADRKERRAHKTAIICLTRRCI